MHRIRAWATRHPRVMDACVAMAAAALALPETIERTEITGVGWLWFAAIHMPLVWRRRAPVLVFWIAFAAVGISDLAGIDEGVFQFFVPLFAVYAVARHRPQRYLWPAVAVIEATAVLAWLQDRGTWGRELVAVTAVLVATALLGLNIRIRRAYLDQLEERARRLERERDQQAQLAVAAERARIAREMHDIVAHNLTVMVALADGATMTATARPERAADVMAKVSTTGREALSEMRRLVGLLRDGPGEPALPAGRAPQPGLADLDPLVDQVRAAGVRVAVTREGTPGGWGPGAELAVYRIVQEALTNTLKHAGPAASAQVRLRYTAGGVELSVTDDGAGRQAAAPAPGGHGLAGMAERAASYGGRVDAGPAPGTGWRVRARLPLGERTAV
jgi:signal transduction histidine kinase